MSEANYSTDQPIRTDARAGHDGPGSFSDISYGASQVKRAGNLLEKGDLKAAEDCLRQALNRVPDHMGCRAYYAVCLAANKRKFVTAEKLVKNIIKDNPNDPTAWYALGRINLLGGRRSQAFKNFERAKRFSCNDIGVKALVEQMDSRRGPVISFLPRGNFLNIFLGQIRAKLGS